MKFTNAVQVKEFLQAVDECKRDIWLESPTGDKYNLKSEFSKYIAVGKLLEERGAELELFCASLDDEARVWKFFDTYPEVLDNKWVQDTRC